jgi:hypothetical protein
MALDPKTKKAQDNFLAARKDLPAKAPDAVKKEYAKLTDAADTWVAQLKNYTAAVETALDHTKYDQKEKELDKAKGDVNNAADSASQIKANYFGHPEALEKLAQDVANKANDSALTTKLTKLVSAASAINGLNPPDKIP